MFTATRQRQRRESLPLRDRSTKFIEFHGFISHFEKKNKNENRTELQRQLKRTSKTVKSAEHVQFWMELNSYRLTWTV